MKRTFTLAALSLSLIQGLQAREDDSVPREDRVPRQAPGVTPTPKPYVPGNVTTLSDRQLAERFAPIVVNEITKDSTGKDNYSDKIDEVSFDVSQTNDFIYISYQILKSWSVDLESDGLISGATAFLSVPRIMDMKTTHHPVDAEDVFVVIKKFDNGDLKLVMYSVNAHGKRLVYTVKDVVAPAELDSFEENNQSYEVPGKWFSFFVRRSIQDLQDFSRKAPQLDERPVVVSNGGSHSLVAARFDLSSISAQMTAGTMTVSGTASMAIPAGVPVSAYVPYKMISNKFLISAMTFSSEVLTGPAVEKADACKQVPVTLNGVSVTSPKLPTHLDPIWYLNRYNPSTLSAIRTILAKKDLHRSVRTIYKNYLSVPEADFSWNHGKRDGDKLTDCRRVDPADVFKRMFPITAKDENGDYTRHDLLNVTAGAYRPKVMVPAAPVK